MAKIIKKIIRVLLIITAVLIAVPSVLFLLLQAPRIQTFTVKVVTKVLSQNSGARITLGRVNYTMFHKIVLEEVLFEDQRGDTLMAVERIDLRIRKIKPSEQLFRFGRIDLRRPDFRLIQDTTGVLNLTQYLATLNGGNERDTTKSIDISFTDIDVHDGAFMLVNMSDTIGTRQGTINFRDMRPIGINGKVRDLKIIPDSISMVIRGLAFSESGGFGCRSLDMNLTVSKKGIFLRDLELLTDSSAISAEKILLMPRDSGSWADFINSVRMDLHFNHSVLNVSDLAYFIRPLEGMSEKITLSGRVTGTVAEMKGRNIVIDYSSSTRLRFDYDISGLPSLSESYLYIDFKEMRTRAADAEDVSIPGMKPLKLPVIAHDMGLISYNGSFTGFTTDFVSFGELTTERGTFSTDLSLKPDGRNTFSFKGFLKTSDVDLGYVTRNDEMFGGLWMHADIDGSMQSFRHLSANINGVIDSVEINDYLYRNVSVAGRYADSIWDGTVTVKDRNINMDIMGRFDLEKSKPEFDFTMNIAHADLNKLNLISGDSIFNATALLTASFKGNKADNIEGDLRLINSTLENSRGKLSIYDFFVTSGQVRGVPRLTLRSDFADAEVIGPYNFDAIGSTVREMLARILPSKFTQPAPVPVKKIRKSEAMFTLSARIKKIDKLNEFLGTGLTISDGSLLTGRFSSAPSEMKAELSSAAITYAGTQLSHMLLTGMVSGEKMEVGLRADTLRLPDKSVLGNFTLGATGHNDTIDLSLRWDNKDGGRTVGEVKTKGYYSINNINRPVLTVGILPSDLTIRNNPWSVNPARIVIDSTSVLFDNILVNSRSSFIRLDGRLSSFPEDRLTMSFEGLNLSYLNNLKGERPVKDADVPELTFGGMMKGSLALSDAFDELLFESNISISDFRLNNNDYGLVTVSSDWDPRERVAAINVFNDFAGRKFFDISGTYTPSSKNADITASTYDMPLDILNPFLKSFSSDLRGVGSGKVRLQGKLKQFTLTGSVMAQDASLKVDFLQTRYSFSDSIRFTPQGIVFRNITINDEKRNQGTISGMLSHRSFKDIGISFDINMDRLLVLNTRPKDTDSFYGTAYASGYAGIRGDEKKLTFNISARTAANTEFFIPLNSSAYVSDYPYITFVDSVKAKEEVKESGNMFVRQEQGSKMELNFDLEITPEAEVQLIMDATTGGVIRGKGEGKLNISLNSRGDVRMVGDYVIRDGDYLFTLGNILNKRFVVENGGTITWNGPIDDADLNIRALYRTKASLSDIYNKLEFPELQERLPVECVLSLSNKLLNPVIQFDILLPTADEETREYLRMAIDTDEKLSRQFLYLLVMNSFYTDPALYSASGSGTGGQISQTTGPGAEILGVTTTTEMLSNQLSNWLSQISNDFDIGFNYRPGNEITDQEVEVALSTQLLNDKVTLNGNVDVGGNQLNTKASAISGEFTIEVRLTDKLRFKVFNRSNNNLHYQTYPYTQGVGVFYRRDFDTLKDLFIIPDERRKKKAVPQQEKDGN